MRNSVLRMVQTAFFIALGLVLPVITGNLTQMGNMFLPMHLPILLCGFVCGWQYGLVAGVVTPLLRSFLFAAPPLFPIAAAMAFELGTYGFLTGVMSRILPRKVWSIYVALFMAMIGGRVVWGIVKMCFAGMTKTTFTYGMFLAGAFTEAIPGIVIQVVIVPVLVIACRRAAGDAGTARKEA